MALNLLQGEESKSTIRVPPRKAGNWFFSTVTVDGFKEPLQIASVPGLSGTPGPKPPYLVIYCQSGSASNWNVFVDWREEVSFAGKSHLRINGLPAAAFEALPLVAGDHRRMKLPAQSSALFKEALEVEVSNDDRKATFLLLHWNEIQVRLLKSCSKN